MSLSSVNARDLGGACGETRGRCVVGLGFGFIHKCIVTSFNCIAIHIDPIELDDRSGIIP